MLDLIIASVFPMLLYCKGLHYGVLFYIPKGEEAPHHMCTYVHSTVRTFETTVFSLYFAQKIQNGNSLKD